MKLHWFDHVAAYGDQVDELWSGASRDVAETTVILGEGFDPRTTQVLERLCALSDCEPIHVIIVQLRRGETSAGLRQVAQKNAEKTRSLAEGRGGRLTRIPVPEVEDPRSLGRVIFRHVREHVAPTSGVIVDISALPSRVYFPIIVGLIRAYENARCREVLVAVCENPRIDGAIRRRGSTIDPGPIGGFVHGLTSFTQTGIRIWAPVLGEQQHHEIRAIVDFQPWDEICPVLPFPARNPRRPDDLILEHEYLFRDPVDVEARNIIYADESNPFDLYRALSRLSERYEEAFRPLGSTKLVLSTHSSKTLSLGVLLASYERRLPVVAAAFGGSYEIIGSIEDSADENSLATFWLCGKPYR